MAMNPDLAFKKALAVSKNYTDEMVIGGGAIKGKNCTVKSITDITGGHRVTFEWTLDDGTVKTGTMDVMDGVDGQDGKGIKSVTINQEEHLIITYTDDTTTDAGKIEVQSAVDSVNGMTGNVVLNASDVGALPDDTSIPTKTSDLTNDSDFVVDASYVHTDNNYDATAKGIVDGVTSALADKVDKVTGKGLSTEDYTSAEKTKLGGIETGAEVNTIESISLNGVDVAPDANKNVALTVITNAVNDLVNYYLKSETYSKTEVDDIVTAIKNSRFEVVATLPTTDIKTNIIYLVPKPSLQTSNVKDEYINLDGTTSGWEKIGDTEIDLSNYVTTQALNTALANYTTTADLTTLLAGKQDTLTFDNIPTENSNNPVKSGGVYTANKNIYEVIGKNGAKNLLENTATSGTNGGITYTVNNDKSVTANGTSGTNGSTLILRPYSAMEAGIYKLSCGVVTGTQKQRLSIGVKDEYGTATYYIANTLDDVEFTVPENATVVAFIVVEAGEVINNLTFYPMIRLASDTDNTYQPYTKTNKELTAENEALTNEVKDMNNVLGAKNFVEIEDFTLLKSADRIKHIYPYNFVNGEIPSAMVRVSFTVSNSNLSTSGSSFAAYASNASIGYVNFGNNGRYSFTFDGSQFHHFYVYIAQNEADTATCTISDIMITLASITDDIYVPYAKTNKELTEENQTLTNQVSAINTQLSQLDFDGAGAHNSIYRGKYLGAEVTAEQYTHISDGTFKDMYIGDYWTIGGVNYRIGAFDYWYNTGDTACTTHHVLIVPDTNLASGKMNDTDITTGGYVGSDLKTGANDNTALATAKNIITTAFGSAHILTHREYFTNAVADGKPSAGAWYDSDIDLMNENMVYGTNIFLPHPDGSTVSNLYTIDKTQIKLFAERPDLITIRAGLWLRDVVSAATFADVGDTGRAGYIHASYSLGVRPAFGLRA